MSERALHLLASSPGVFMSLGKRGSLAKPGASTADVNKAVATTQRLRHTRTSLLNFTLQKASTKKPDYNGIFLKTFDGALLTEEEETEVLLEKSHRVMKRASLVLPGSGVKRRSRELRDSSEEDARALSSLEGPPATSSQASNSDDEGVVDVTRRY